MTRYSKLLFALPLFVAACGSTPQDRALSGGGIGAAGGAILGAVTGWSVIGGTLLGTGLGAAIGGLTSPENLNLGKPIWQRASGPKNSGTSVASNGYSQSVVDIQRDLKRLGYAPGPVDGRLGPKTKAAIARFESDQGYASGRRIDQLAKDTERVAAAAP
jgi:osmotically inducible lipoprotein OsmB